MPEVRLLAGLRERSGRSTLRLEADRVGELIERLGESAGAGLAAVLYADPESGGRTPSRDLRVLVNGRSIEFLAGLDTRLTEGDQVTLYLSGARGWPGG